MFDNELRRRAEQQTQPPSSALEPLSPEAAQNLIHELRVHQVELEMQNDELRQAEQSLACARARYFDLYDLAPVGYLTLDETGLILEANLLASTLLGSSRGDLVRQSLNRFVHTADQDDLYRFFRQAAGTAEPQQCELRLARHSGAPVWVQLGVSATRDSDNGKALCKVVLSDITETKKLAAQAVQTERLASLGLLAAGVAHEINNPLAYVLANLEALTEQLPRHLTGEPQRVRDKESRPEEPELIVRRLKDALEGVQRIAKIAKSLGRFSRPDGGEAQPFQVQQAIESALVLAQNDIRHRAKLKTDYGDTPDVDGSQARLSQVILNLLMNAAQSIEDGNVEHNEICIRTWQENSEVCVEVRDTGQGMSQEQLANIFEPFFTTKNHSTNAGLGLYLAGNIVTSCGGRLLVHSEPQKGTAFTVRLPIAPGVPEAVPIAVHAPATDTETHGRLLLVDDEPGVLEIMAHCLRTHTVIQAPSGAQAKVLLEQDQDFDLILCDLMMPNVSGVDLHQWLTKTHPTLAERVVFVTGGICTSKANKHLKETKAQWLEKPVPSATLRAFVRDKLTEQRKQQHQK